MTRQRDRANAADAELRRARIIVAAGVTIWAAIAALVMMRHGAIASVVLVGWGGSIVVCLVCMFGPFALAELRPTAHEAPAADGGVADAAPSIDVIDLRDAVLAPQLVDEVAVPLG